MSNSQETPKIPLPNGWKKQVRSTVLHVLSLAQYAAAYTSGWAADSVNTRVRLRAEWDRANQELLLLREEIRVKDARLARIDPLTDWFSLLTKKGQMTAQKLYDSDGWVAYLSTNPFCRTTPAGSTRSSQFQNSVLDPLAGAWMAMLIWRHYEFTQDEAYFRRLLDCYTIHF